MCNFKQGNNKRQSKSKFILGGGGGGGELDDTGAEIDCKWSSGNIGNNGSFLKLDCGEACISVHINESHWIMWVK